MTEAEALEQAVARAEAEVAELEAALATGEAMRHALTVEALTKAQAGRDALVAAEAELLAQAALLRTERDALQAKAERPAVHLPLFIGGPLRWYLRTTGLAIFLGSVVAANRYVHSPGLVLALLVGMPVAFVLVLVAGSLRESGIEDAPRGSPGPGAGPAQLPADDGRVEPAAGGPGAAHVAGPADDGAGAADGEGP